MRDEFERVAGWLTEALRGDESFDATFAGERSDFARFNAGRVRQAGSGRGPGARDWVEGSWMSQ